ncbi:hypothetical protein G7Z17_g4365 [Cylindrodendrum hubeiense]|uniref:C2H2-type domain-containing protein n=1 Tax=Cylindrodendrum hubeiense TaxID=595255 RepID=A0A9P5LJ12_9HYPO|nr:hypothetical protein G7Z17_g4365 [Cylindrodendrum hubeiense]
MDTETPADIDSSANAAAPKKPSIRILDEGGPATREEDLSDGPLLLHIGDDIGGHGRDQMDLDPVFRDSSQLEASRESVPLPMTLRLSTASPLDTISQSELSSGKLFSVTTEGPTLADVCQFLAEFEARRIRSALDPFPWNYEFSWENSWLSFNGEQFHVTRETGTSSFEGSPNSEIASTAHPVSHGGSETRLPSDVMSHHILYGVGASTKSSEVGQDLERAFAAFSTSSAGPSSSSILGVASDTQGHDHTQAAIAQERTIDQMVKLIHDYYLRSYAPQRKGNNKSNQNVPYPSHKSDRSAKGRNGQTKGASGSPDNDGSGEGDDEYSHNRGQGSSRTAFFWSEARLACPFIKWKPRRYDKTCLKKFTTISLVKDHLNKVHYVPHCPKCYSIFGEGNSSVHACPAENTASVDPPAGFITDAKLEKIKKRVNKSNSPEQQWQYIYEELFPNEPLCLDPTLHHTITDKMVDTEYCIRDLLAQRNESAQKCLHELIGDSKNRGENPAQTWTLVLERLLPLFIEHASDGESHRHSDVPEDLPHDDDEAVETAYSNEKLDPNLVGAIVSQDTNNYSMQQAPDPTEDVQMFPLLGFNEHFGLTSQEFGNPLNMEGIEEGDASNTEIGDLGCTMPETGNWDTPGSYLELLSTAEVPSFLWAEE